MLDFFENIARKLPRLKTPVQLSGLAVVVAAYVVHKEFAPAAILAQILIVTFGVMLLVFGQVFRYLDVIPLKQRSPLIVTLFVFFCVLIVAFAIVAAIDIRNHAPRDMDAILEGLSNPDEAKQRITAIELARHASSALPTVEIALGNENQTIRRGALFTLEAIIDRNDSDRESVIDFLRHCFASQNESLRRGAVDTIVELDHKLTDTEAGRLFEAISEHLGKNAEACAKESSGHVVLNIIVFLDEWSELDSHDLLLGIPQHCPSEYEYEAARKHAFNVLPDVTERLPVTTKRSILDSLRPLINLDPRLSPKVQRAIQGITRQLQ